MQIKANGISIEVEDSGADGSQADRPVVLLIMGLSMQLVAWPQAMVQALLDAGYRVLRLDNRDIGLSQHFDEAGTPNLLWATVKSRLGLPLKPPYTLADMAQDAIGVLDALGIARAHLLGVSMGGMIAQRVAVAAPERVRSLISVMSSSGARDLPPPRTDVMRALMSRPAGQSREALLDHGVALVRLIGSPAWPMSEDEVRRIMGEAMDRSYHPAGMQRQLLAIGADTERPAALAGISAPTLVLHGRDDPLIPIACGEDTARRIPSARFVGIAGMGHDLAPGVIASLMPHVLPHLGAH